MVHHRLTTTVIFFLGFLFVMYGLTVSSSTQAYPDEDGVVDVVINGGRNVVMGQREVKESVRDDIKEISSKLSGATSIDHALFGGQQMDFNGKTNSDLGHKKGITGFVAFSADYHGPKHHIPKHN